jgi:hypothetical protein
LLARGREALRHEDSEQVLRLEIGVVQRIGVGAQRAPDCGGELMLVGNVRDRGQVGLRRRHARAIDRVGVEIGVVIIGDHPVDAARRVRLQDFVEKCASVLLALLVGDEEGANRRTVLRDRRILDPGPVRILEEVVARLHRLVDPVGLDADVGALLLRLAGLVAGAGVARAERERGRENQEQRLLHHCVLSPKGI